MEARGDRSAERVRVSGEEDDTQDTGRQASAHSGNVQGPFAE